MVKHDTEEYSYTFLMNEGINFQISHRDERRNISRIQSISMKCLQSVLVLQAPPMNYPNLRSSELHLPVCRYKLNKKGSSSVISEERN